MPPGEVHEQHVLSQVLLARWAVDGEVVAFNLATGTSRLRSPRSEGWVEDFIAAGSAEVEAVWGEVEDKAFDALNAVEAEDLFSQPAQVEVIRDLLAVHIARSKGFLAVFRRALAGVAEGQHTRNLMDLLRVPAVQAALFEHQTGGLVPAGREGRAYAAERQMTELLEALGGNEAFRDAVMEHFGTAKRWLADKGLRIAVAEAGEFLVGDMPVLTQDTAALRAGLLDVPMRKASNVTLPLGPRHTLALSTTEPDGYEVLAGDGVLNLNRLQVGTAPSKVYWRPGAEGLEDLAVTEWSDYRQQ